MKRDDWQARLTREELARGYDDGFKLLFCPWRLIETADTAFVSLNPGADPSGELMRVASDERGNSYLVKRRAPHGPIARQYELLCDFIVQDPEEVLAGALMPFRTPRWIAHRDAPHITVAAGFWHKVLNAGRLRRVICVGRQVETAIAFMSGAQLTRDIPANWGRLRLRRYETDGGFKVYGLPHLSTFKLFSRPECHTQLEELFEIASVS